jgi:hypothetical protein
MRQLLLVILVGICITWMACPFHSKMSLCEGKIEKVDKGMLGKWGSSIDPKLYYYISQLSDNTYQILEVGNVPDSTKYFMYTTTIGGTQFAQIFEKEDMFNYYSLDFNSRASQINLRAVSESIPDNFSDSEDMRKYFKKHKVYDYFFDSTAEVFLRK